MLKKKKMTILGFFLIYFVDTTNAENNIPDFKQIICTVKVKNNFHKLFLDVADNEEKRSYGLMNRKDMKRDSGMLFIWTDRQIRNFWMKNTYFNLDLFFLNNKGIIIEIYKNAIAFDETIIKNKKKVNFVIELKSGEYKFLKGDRFNCPFKELLE